MSEKHIVQKEDRDIVKDTIKELLPCPICKSKDYLCIITRHVKEKCGPNSTYFYVVCKACAIAARNGQNNMSEVSRTWNEIVKRQEKQHE